MAQEFLNGWNNLKVGVCLETMYIPGDHHHVKICQRPAKFEYQLKEGFRPLCGIHARMKKYDHAKLTEAKHNNGFEASETRSEA